MRSNSSSVARTYNTPVRSLKNITGAVEAWTGASFLDSALVLPDIIAGHTDGGIGGDPFLGSTLELPEPYWGNITPISSKNWRASNCTFTVVEALFAVWE